MEWKYIRESHDYKNPKPQARHAFRGIHNVSRSVPRELQHKGKLLPDSQEHNFHACSFPALAPLHDSINIIRNRLINVLLPHHVSNPRVL
jgi:hypothetical protein